MPCLIVSMAILRGFIHISYPRTGRTAATFFYHRTMKQSSIPFRIIDTSGIVTSNPKYAASKFPPVQDWNYQFEERAAIMEYDAKLPRTMAEYRAEEDLRRLRGDKRQTSVFTMERI